MLTYSELVTLERSIRDARVLSVYLDGSAADPAVYGTRRLRLDHVLDDARSRVAHGSREDQEQFAACEQLLFTELAAQRPGLSARGWVAFVTPGGIVHESTVDAPLPNAAFWKTGASVTPYLAAIEDEPSAIVAVVDARRAMVYHLEGGVLDRGEMFHAYHTMAPVAHMGDVPSPGFHGGTRGTTGHDAAQRALRTGTIRMLRSAMDRVAGIAKDDDAIVLGGIPRIVAHAAAMIEEFGDRVVSVKSLDVHSTPPQIVDAVHHSTADMRERALVAAVRELMDDADAAGLGALGVQPTRKALHSHAVQVLYVSANYMMQHLVHADGAAAMALDQDARVEIVRGKAAGLLDTRGGMGARLRFRVEEATPAAVEHERVLVGHS